jgi:uncharacterized glyoxalase superfamily protein PhnB
MAAELLQSAWKIIPQFRSRSVLKTVEFYREELEWTVEHDGEYPQMCSAFVGKKADANIYFFHHKDQEFVASSAMIALGTTQLDEFYEHLRARGKIEITEPIADEPWGYRQFSIKDIDGNTLTFFKFLEGGNPGDE